MTDRTTLNALKQRITSEPAMRLEDAALVLDISTRTLRRRLHEFEFRRGPNRHIWITLRSVARYLGQEAYQRSKDFDLTSGFTL